MEKEKILEKEKATATEIRAVKAKIPELVYSVEEFQKMAQTIFNCQPECVKAAFMVAQKTTATEPEAKKIVSDFMNKEVK